MLSYEELKSELKRSPKTWLITGCGGFIGSNLLEELLRLNQKVVGLDNFSTGFKSNLTDVNVSVGELFNNFTLIEGDIRDLDVCLNAVKGVDIVLHQAALGSVPRSIKDPLNSHQSNVDGFINMLNACRVCGVKRFVYASSSSVYGDDEGLPKIESRVGNVLSPYAATKKINEIYSNVFWRVYGLETIGLRYFNVFGKRQDPNGAYAAVIPKWYKSFIKNEEIFINGDGSTSRDFCFVDNVVQMNLLAGSTVNSKAFGEVFNCAFSATTSLLDLFTNIKLSLAPYLAIDISERKAEFKEFRTGDIKHSHANIEKAAGLLGYKPTHDIKAGLKEVSKWYATKLK